MKTIAFYAFMSLFLCFAYAAEYDDPTSVDLNNDGIIDIKDFAALSAKWLQSFPDPNQFAYIPAGQFEMGDHLDEGAAWEKPVHTIQLDAYYIGRYEVTNRQYCNYLNAALSQNLIEVIGNFVYAQGGTEPFCHIHGDNFPYKYSQLDYSGGLFTVLAKDGRDMSEDPMVQVTWYGAVAYCDFYGYRLPTEAEWEYAARGGFNGPYYRFPWGEGISHSQANYYANDTTIYYDISPTNGYHPDFYDTIQPITAPVNTFSANRYGLYNVAGNVWEWCSDWYDADYYQYCVDNTIINNPQGPASGPGRVVRGGGFYQDPQYCRVSARGYLAQDYLTTPGGFRAVIDVE